MDVFSRKTHRHLQRRHGGVCTIEDDDLQQIVGAALLLQGIQHALSIQTVRADDHDDREFRVRAFLHGAGFSKTGLKSIGQQLKGMYFFDFQF